VKDRRAIWLVVALTAVAFAPDAGAQPSMTFTKDVAPILFAHCSSCHRAGEIGGFSLLTYEDVRPRARAIARATLTRAMPPWKPEPGYGEFAGVRRLSDAQIDTIRRWVDGGAIEGNAADLPPVPAFPEGWRLGQPDLVIQMREPFTVAAGSRDVLRNFVIPIPVDRPRYVSGLEFRPGNARIVHHANFRIDTTRRSRAMDEADPRPGYDGFMTTASFPEGHFLGWTPGQLPRQRAWRGASIQIPIWSCSSTCSPPSAQKKSFNRASGCSLLTSLQRARR
jgi:mono/diheme cytochrome c family protein